MQWGDSMMEKKALVENLQLQQSLKIANFQTECT